jgi:cytochrome c-type biogenesis protein CcsB
MEATFSLAAYVLLFLGVVISLVSLWKPNKIVSRLALIAVTLAFICLTLALINRSIISGRLPFATMYEFTFLFAWGILLFLLILRTKFRTKLKISDLLTSLVALLTIVIISYGSTLPSEVRPLMPALQSVWLEIHVITAIVAYGAFGLSCCLGILYLVKEKSADHSIDKLDSALHWSVVVGFPFMTLVLITGAVWAEEVWGRWWSWDPKETWALITWLIYAGYLHARKTYGWQGKKAAIMVIVGFMAVLFTFFGVSLLLPGAHSYV